MQTTFSKKHFSYFYCGSLLLIGLVTACSGGNAVGGSQTVSGSCAMAEDCGYWFCHCDDGGGVNSRNCTNGSCLHAEEICAESCESIGEGWTGDYSIPGDGQTDTNNNNNNGGGNTGGDDTGGNSGPSCSAAEDCPYWYCYCEEGPPVNARTCDNGSCEDVNAVCPGACADFGTTWTGQYGSSTDNNNGGSGGGGGGGGSDNSAQCDAFFNTTTCGDCGYYNCCDEGAACDDNSSCRAILQCIVDCVNCVNGCGTQAACEADCTYLYPSGSGDYYSYSACMDYECYSECH